MSNHPAGEAFRPLRSFLIAAGFAILLVVLGNPLADALGFGHWSDRKDERKLAWLQRSGDRPTVLVLGSSRSKFAFVARWIETDLTSRLGRPTTAFNASQGDTGPLEASWFLGELIATNGCPELVALDLNAEGLNATSLRIARSLRLYLPSNRWIATLPHIDSRERAEAYLGSFTSGWGHLLRAVGSPRTSAEAVTEAAEIARCRGSVYGPAGVDCQIDHNPNLKRRERSRVLNKIGRYHRRLETFYRMPDFEIGGLPAAGMERLAELCRRCSAELVIVSLPNGFPWAHWGWEEEVEATRRYAENFAARHGAAHLDLSHLAEELDEEDFYDLSHLSRRGARGATDRLVALAAARLAP